MRYEIIFAPQAISDLGELKASTRARVVAVIERHLRHEPAKVSKSRIKRLRGILRPQFRLRVGDTRVLYDVAEGSVEVLAVVAKGQFMRWIEKHGERDESSSV